METIPNNVLIDIFGDGSEIDKLGNDYRSYLNENESNADSSAANDDQIQSIIDSAQKDLYKMGLSELEIEIYDINDQLNTWTESLEELGGATNENIALINKWKDAQIEAAEEVYALDVLKQELDLKSQLFELLEDEAALQGVINEQRQLELDAMDESLRPLQSLVWGLEDAAQDFENVSAALETVQGTIDTIMGDTDSVQSKEYMAQRYDELFTAALSGDPEAAQEFAGFAPEYLDFMKDYGNPTTQENVLDDLFEVETLLEDQMSTEEDMLTTMQDIWEDTHDIAALLEANKPTIQDRVEIAYQEGAVGEAIYQGMNKVLGQENEDANNLLDNFLKAKGYAQDDITFGQMSNYPTALHSNELIVPLDDMSIPGSTRVNEKVSEESIDELIKKLSTTNGNIQVKVYVGNKEIKDITVETIRTNPQAQKIIKRVTNV